MAGLGIGIVGPGWVAREHAKAFKTQQGCRVVAVAGRRREALNGFVRDTGIDAETLLDYDQLLAHPSVGAVVICTPNHLHAAQAIAALNAGKHVLIEKPAACSPEELTALEGAAARAPDLQVAVSFELRWNPLLILLRRLLAAGYTGDPFYLEVDYFSGNQDKWYVGYRWMRRRDQGCSVLLSTGCHALDALLQLHPGPVRQVSACQGNFTGAFEYEATLVAVLRFADGTLAKVANVMEGNTPYQFHVRVHGPHGTIVNNRVWSHVFEGQTDWVTVPTVLPDSADVTHHPFAPQAAAFIEAIASGAPSESGLRNAVRVHRLIFAIEESARSGRPVEVNL